MKSWFCQERPCQKAVSESENHRLECCQSNGRVYVTAAEKLGFRKIKEPPEVGGFCGNVLGLMTY
jgi:hypothetical protein